MKCKTKYFCSNLQENRERSLGFTVGFGGVHIFVLKGYNFLLLLAPRIATMNLELSDDEIFFKIVFQLSWYSLSIKRILQDRCLFSPQGYVARAKTIETEIIENL